ncbi:hypothetical protein AJ79_03231 [Helicocarpus griseus UAMH5409]|uniref:Large ribosomal subunit protein uL23m n=1 Tax=Helicocarpus griseus UAMH5409 TaxID=1447875 RepID=A0A2B7XQS2_9EURO|nr:hypothetical protein AJ79_03231 [Helicocarpus griseus UAMH5409]
MRNKRLAARVHAQKVLEAMRFKNLSPEARIEALEREKAAKENQPRVIGNKKLAALRERLKRDGEFLRPYKTPREMRKQIYLPDFVLTLVRTPFLPPRYASFWVPLTFNKLDIRDYLKHAYGVNVLKVRSYVEQQKITRERPCGKEGYGKWRRPRSRKKMTVEMSEPFVWPEEPTDYKPWDKDNFFEAKKYQEDASEAFHPEAQNKPPETRRETIAEQAERLLEGKETWQPTWKALGLNYNRPLAGVKGAMSPAEILQGGKSEAEGGSVKADAGAGAGAGVEESK